MGKPRKIYIFTKTSALIYRNNVEIATKLYDEILRKVPGAIVELTPGADGMIFNILFLKLILHCLSSD